VKALQQKVHKRSKLTVSQDAGNDVSIDIVSINENDKYFGSNHYETASKLYWQIPVDDKIRIK
jgi:hypothetical protein